MSTPVDSKDYKLISIISINIKNIKNLYKNLLKLRGKLMKFDICSS